MRRPFNTLLSRFEKHANYQGIEHALENDYEDSPLRKKMLESGDEHLLRSMNFVRGGLGGGAAGYLMSDGSPIGTVAGAGIGAVGERALGSHFRDAAMARGLEHLRNAHRSVVTSPDATPAYDLQEALSHNESGPLYDALVQQRTPTNRLLGGIAGGSLGALLGASTGALASNTGSAPLAGGLAGGALGALGGAALGPTLSRHEAPHLMRKVREADAALRAQYGE